MKVEVEFSEIEDLKKELELSQKKVRELTYKLEDLSSQKLEEKAVELSLSLFENYMAAVFEKLGFNQNETKTILIDRRLSPHIGAKWWNKEKIQIEVGATITTSFKSAFVHLGILKKE